VTLADVRSAAERIRPLVVRTALEPSRALSEILGVDVWLKLECFQSTGSFKLRGALNALHASAAAGPVVTASAGNHGLGLARAAVLLGRSATVVVPTTASQAKVDALLRSGATLVQHGQTYDEAEAEGLRLARERGARFVSAYNDADVVAGGGTVALEVLEDLPAVRMFLVPAGGGGLIGGVGVAAHGFDPEIAIVGVQSVASPALHAALAHGGPVTVEVRPSLADGLAGNIEPSSITYDLLRRHVRQVVLVEEAEILEAMRWTIVHERVVVEGSAAVGVAALLHGRLPQIRGPLVILLTGRNVSGTVLSDALRGGLPSSL
jgi:threonine dehydratase